MRTLKLVPLLVVVCSLAAFLFVGCNRPRPHVQVELIRNGMSVKEVDAILGKPIKVFDSVLVSPKERPTHFRFYQGDGDHEIHVTFENDAVTDFREWVPKHKLPIG